MKNTPFYPLWLLALVFLSFRTATTLDQCTMKSKNLLPTVEIRRTQDGHLGAWVTNHPDFPQTLFLLQGFSNDQLEAPIRIENIAIEYQPEYVVFSAKNAPTKVAFQLKGTSSTLSSTAVQGFTGWGLIRVSGEQIAKTVAAAGTNSYPAIASMDCKCFPEKTTLPFCDSGGAGATQCGTFLNIGKSKASCFVSCAKGHNACCKE